MSRTSSPETSIVIRAFNEERWLPQVLSAIARQRNQDYEVLLVDSGSVDHTRQIAEANGARVLRLRPEDFTFGHSLNVGLDAARGRFVAILSAHAIPVGEQWLESLVEPLRDEGNAMVFGRQRGHAVSKLAECNDFERTFGESRQRLVPPNYFANNANSAIRRELWESHPFDETLPGLEDIEWAKHWMTRGLSVVYEPEACICHVHQETWPQVRRRYHREGIAARWVGIRGRKDIPVEIWRELRWYVADLLRLAQAPKQWSLLGEVTRFRYEKTVGTVGGILDGESTTNFARRAEMYFDKTAEAVVIRGPRDAALEERPIPALKPGEILVRVAYEGVCATDLEVFDGTLGYYKSGMAEYPIVPGHESSGTVVALGANVIAVSEDDRVVVECIQGCARCPECERDNAIACDERREVGVIGHDGGYATYLVARAQFAHRVPTELPLAEAALAEPLAVVLKALRRLGASSPDDHPRECAVVGAGPIGHLAVRVLAQRGHNVTVYDRDATRLGLLEDVARTESSLEDLARFDWLVEATGDQSVLETMLHGSGTGATLLLLGLPYARRSFSFESIVGFDRTVIGSVGSNGQDFEAALATLGALNTSAFLEATFPLGEYSRAWDVVRERKHLKVMLKVDSDVA